jgi:predicted acetyltransferase
MVPGKPAGIGENVMKDIARHNVILQDLGDGLVLRCPTQEDTDALAMLNAEVFSGSSRSFEIYTREAMSEEDPGFRLDDITVVEDTLTGAIISTISLSSHTFSYGGVLFGAGRIAWAATHPDYRGRGLIRKQIEVIHERSSQRGHKLLLVGGIDIYLRFGYYPAWWECRQRSWNKAEVPLLRDDESELYSLRPATEEDVPFIAALYEHAMSRSLVANVRDEAIWRYEVLLRNKDSYAYTDCAIIESVKGEPVGYLVYSQEWLDVEQYELKSNMSWQAVTPSVLRYVFDAGKDMGRLESLFRLDFNHPLWEMVESQICYDDGRYLK